MICLFTDGLLFIENSMANLAGGGVKFKGKRFRGKRVHRFQGKWFIGSTCLALWVRR